MGQNQERLNRMDDNLQKSQKIVNQTPSGLTWTASKTLLRKLNHSIARRTGTLEIRDMALQEEEKEEEIINPISITIRNDRPEGGRGGG